MTTSRSFVSLWVVGCVGVLLLFAPAGQTAPALDACPQVGDDIDYIVVGGGTAGCVVASRLSENPPARVVLLEAGKNPYSHNSVQSADIPLYSRKLMNTDLNWNYSTERQSNCCIAFPNQAPRVPSGKGLGGTGNINSMIYTRGNRHDYDRLYFRDWDYDTVLETYKAMEKYQSILRREDHYYHGFNGSQMVSSPIYKTPLAEAFLQAGNELGSYEVDCNAENQSGFTNPPTDIRDGMRWNSYRSYLEPAMDRPNLWVITEALVSKVIFDDFKRAVGVNYEYRNRKCTLKANKEIIISAGAIRSPQLLMLSGIGPRDYLDQFQIPLMVDLPGVGQNLRDHVLVSGIQFQLNQSIGLKFSEVDTEENLNLWKLSRTGPLSSIGVEGIAFFPAPPVTKFDYAQPSALEISMFTDSGLNPKSLDEKYQDSFVLNNSCHYVTFIPILLQTKSKGTVTLRSTNPRDSPLIDPKYLSHPDDVLLLLEALKTALSIGRTKSFRKYGAELVKFLSIPGCEMFAPESDEFWTCYLIHFSSASWHFVGTNKMGPETDPMRVVDSHLRVHGVSGLRVADLSVLPLPMSGHTFAIAVMIGEKAAEFIKTSEELMNTFF